MKPTEAIDLTNSSCTNHSLSERALVALVLASSR